MAKHLYMEDGTGVNGGNMDIDAKIKIFVDEICENYAEYLDSDLELYVIEEVISRFCHKRIINKVRANNKEEK